MTQNNTQMKYDVVIQAKVIKTIRVEAKDRDEASELAHQIFEVGPQQKINENYSEETIAVSEVKS